MLYGRKDVSDKDLPHRTSLTNLIYEQYLKDHCKLKLDIEGSLGRVSFTSDIWSDPNLTSFLAMTAHFCRRPGGPGSLEIAHQLLAFRVVQGSHDGENIGQIMYDIVKEAGAHRKVIARSGWPLYLTMISANYVLTVDGSVDTG